MRFSVVFLSLSSQTPGKYFSIGRGQNQYLYTVHINLPASSTQQKQRRYETYNQSEETKVPSDEENIWSLNRVDKKDRMERIG
jgi:hypothetical protein